MKVLGLLSKLAISAAILGTVLAGPVPVWGAEHIAFPSFYAPGSSSQCVGYISGDDEHFEIEPGQCVIIQGIRRHCGKVGAPNFARLMASSRAISTRPANGTLSDGGTGSRESQTCEEEVDVRIIVYTPNPGFIGEDHVEFYSAQSITITVLPPK